MPTLRTISLLLWFPTFAWATDPVAPTKGPVLAPQLDDSEVPRPVRLQVSFIAPARARAREGRVALDDGANRRALDAVIDTHGLVFAPLYEDERTVEALRARAERRSGRVQPDLLGTMRVFPADGTVEGLEAAGDALQALELVALAQIVGVRTPPPVDLSPTTPDYTARQSYCGSDPGISANQAHTRGFTGAGIRFSDVEYGWLAGHEEFISIDLGLESGTYVPSWVFEYGWEQHGTAVMGEVAGPDNGYGITGCAPDVTVGTYPEYVTYSRRAEAIVNAASDSEPGDVVLLEMQAVRSGGGDGEYGPAELSYSVWQATSVSVDAGVVIVGAAGNGDQNLDSSAYDAYMEWGDSGAILVGAGGSDSRHNKLGFSTYGSRVDVHAWGQNVFTTGYGNFASLGSDNAQDYTQSFSGTSSASPIVASAAILVQDAAKQIAGEPLDPRELRTLLIDTGIAQGSGGHIGPIPDVDAAIDYLLLSSGDDPRILDVVVPESLDEGTAAAFSVSTQVPDGISANVSWVFGDGETGGGDSVSHTYTDDGSFTVIVTLTDELGRTDEERVDIEVANVSPTVTLEDVTDTWIEGTGRTLRGAATDPGDDVLTYTWDLGDGTEEGVDLTAVEGTWPEGLVTVVLTVEDGDGGVGSDTLEFNVINGPPVIESIDISDARKKDEVSLKAVASDPGGDALTYAWDFGDGASAEGRDVVHTWTSKGRFDVVLTVSDPDGGSVSETRSVSVAGGCGCSAVEPVSLGWGALFLAALLGRRRRA